MKRAWVWMALVYVVALAVAAVAGWAVGHRHPLVVVAVADVAATVVVFGFSRAFRNSSFYDPYWSVAPIAIAGWWWLLEGPADAVPVRQAVVLGLVTLWGIRLTGNLLAGWSGLDHEDWRYVKLRQDTGRAY